MPSRKRLLTRDLPQVRRTLTRRERLRRRPEFLRVQQTGSRTRGRWVTLFVLPNERRVNRVGVIATRRLGGAVRRNRVKRLAREMFRRDKGRPGVPGLDVVMLPRPAFPDVPFPDLQADYRSTLRRAERSHG